MSAKLSEYMRTFREQFYPELFSFECVSKLARIEKLYGDRVCAQTLAELSMNGEAKTFDYSIGIDTPEDIATEHWLEIDYKDFSRSDASSGEIPFSDFYKAANVRPEEGIGGYFKSILPRLLGKPLAEALTPSLERVLRALSGKCDYLYGVGAMKSRGALQSLRVEPGLMRRTRILAFLSQLGWKGNLEHLDQFLRTWVPVAGRFFIDFDLYEDGLSEKLGISMSARTRRIDDTARILKKAKADGYLTEERFNAFIRWLKAWPKMNPMIQNDISHVKFSILEGRVIAAKAYLRQSDLFIAEEAPALCHPWQMNLELSDKCPLRCPQCYVHVNEGREMPLDTAIYWLRDAKAAGISDVALSGGETACYPYITEVIEECERLGLRSAVAFSGTGLDRKKLREVIDAGAKEIYISLNGSTEAVNALSRDGYEAAIRALSLLKDEGFSETGINWVMHRSNSKDFPEMIALGERFQVKRLIILSLKPDSLGAMEDYPAREDFSLVSELIKAYKGPMVIDAENCHSPLRALIRQGYLFNTNKGLFRGCGAGRDSISITCEGKLIPCRHLNRGEEWESIMDYWNNSAFLKKLRAVYDNPTGRCAACGFNENCLPCIAVGYKRHGRIAFQMEECPIGSC